MRVVTLLAFIFLQSRVFKGVFVQVFVAGAALPDRDRFEQVGRIRCMGIVALQTISLETRSTMLAACFIAVTTDT